ncbi:fumarate reductase subunit C [Halomonas sp. PA5]|nr:fumarate reductase subunit C [Halomonas sp. PA5]
MGYLPELKRNWWLKHRFFMAYMAREATVVPLVFFVLSLIAGLFSLLQGPESWQGWLQFMQHPLVMGIHLLAFAASLFHAWTFFQLFPRVMPVRLGERAIHASWMIAGQWLGVVAVLILFAWVFGGGAS